MNQQLLLMVFFFTLLLSTICALSAYILRQRRKLKSLNTQKGVLIEALQGYSDSNRYLQARVTAQQKSIFYLLTEMGFDLPPDAEYQIVPAAEY